MNLEQNIENKINELKEVLLNLNNRFINTEETAILYEISNQMSTIEFAIQTLEDLIN